MRGRPQTNHGRCQARGTGACAAASAGASGGTRGAAVVLNCGCVMDAWVKLVRDEVCGPRTRTRKCGSSTWHQQRLLCLNQNHKSPNKHVDRPYPTHSFLQPLIHPFTIGESGPLSQAESRSPGSLPISGAGSRCALSAAALRRSTTADACSLPPSRPCSWRRRGGARGGGARACRTASASSCCSARRLKRGRQGRRGGGS